MADHNAVLRLVEYYSRYWILLVTAFSINALILAYINKKLAKTARGFVPSLQENRRRIYAPNLTFVLLCAVAVLLSVNLTINDIDIMESSNIAMAKKIISADFLTFFNSALVFAHQPLYPLMLNMVMRVFDPQQYALVLRLISVFWATMAVYLAYRLSLAIFNKRALSYFVLFFLSANELFYFYSRRIEAYSFFCFLAMLSYYYFWEIFISGRTRGLWKYVLVNILCFLAHYLTLFVIFSQFLCVMILKFKKYIFIAEYMRFMKALAIFNFTLILASPQIFISLLHNTAVFSQRDRDLYLGFDYAYGIVSNILRFIFAAPFSGLFLCLFIFLSILLFLMAYRQNQIFFIMTGSLFLTCLVFQLLTMLRMGQQINRLYPSFRYIIFVVPFTVMAYGCCLFFENAKLPRRIAAFALVSFIFICNIQQSRAFCLQRSSPEYKRSADFIKKEFKSGDCIAYPGDWFKGIVDMNFGNGYRYFGVKTAKNMEIIEEVRILSKAKKTGYERVWVTIPHEDCFGVPHINPLFLNEYSDFFKKNLSYIKSWHGDKIDVYLFARKDREAL